ncbi:AAA family ATPase, partial [Candidatus Bipolaricaulota bacterium]
MAVLEGQSPNGNWARIVEELARTVADLFRHGASAVALRTTGDESFVVPLAIEPFIYEGLPFVLFGQPDAGKSYIAAVIASLAALGERIPGTPFAATQRLVPLICDWDASERNLRSRIRRIEKGLRKCLDEKVYYRFCDAPLASSAEQIMEIVEENSIGLLVVDSLGPAAGGDLNAPQPAEAFFAALRQIGVTSVIL